MSEISKIVSDERRNKLFAGREIHNGFKKVFIRQEVNHQDAYTREEALDRYRDSYK